MAKETRVIIGRSFFLLASLLSVATAFTLAPSSRLKFAPSPGRIHAGLLSPRATNSPDSFSPSEFQEMDDLIISLSLEPTDDSRRKRIAELFAQQLAKPDGAPKRFTALFDQVLIVVGDRIQTSAKTKAMENANAPEGSDRGSSDDFTEDTTGFGKSPEERQLWAMVDMMVQTKTIVKKASGDLGSKGSFS